ncbi:hypothetical protein AB0B94_30855 [Micromonospora sp. NPDC048986]|uniref:hypothetical protein n=1 Tax=Micromonospora sp. NPDC048986 TaxID=3155644 RepID=UPI0033C35C19
MGRAALTNAARHRAVPCNTGPPKEATIATPKLNAGQIADLRAFAEEFLAAHETGGYADNSMRIREGNLRGFLLFLEGKYDPATDKGKRRTP